MSCIVLFCSCIFFRSFWRCDCLACECVCVCVCGGGGGEGGRGEGMGSGLGAFRAFVRFVLVWVCRFLLPLGVWEGLRFVIVALSGLFSNLFFVLI